jgi:hypothetical protein
LRPAADSRLVRQIAAHDEVTVSVRAIKKAHMIELVRVTRDSGQQDIGFSSRPFVLCGLPIKRPPRGVTLYTRRNGNLILDIQAHERYGLPFGQDRLIPIWVATIALRTNNPVIRFKSAAEILDTFGLPKDGKTYRRLVEGFKRIFGCTFFFGTAVEHNVTELARLNYFSRMRLWYAAPVEQETLPGDFENEIVLSPEFWAELRLHPIPVDLAVVKALADSPGATDFYVWVCWRCWKAKGPTAIPLFGSSGLREQLGVSGYGRERKFRQTIQRWIGTTKAVWPEAPVALSENGDALVVSSGRAINSQPTL